MNIILASVFVISSILTPLTDQSPPTIYNTVDCQPHRDSGFEIPGWVTNETWFTPMPIHTSGNAVWYAPWMMEGTANYRGMSLDGFVGGIATNSVGDMGKTAWIKRNGLEWEGPYLIVDVSQRNHAYHHAINVGSIFEVDFPTALRWGIVSKSNNKKGYVVNRWLMPNVEMFISLQSPNPNIESHPVNYKEWYLENLEICDGEPNKRWKIEDWMIMDYSDYEIQLAALEDISIVIADDDPEIVIINSCSEEVANLQAEIERLEAEIEQYKAGITYSTPFSRPVQISISFQHGDP